MAVGAEAIVAVEAAVEGDLVVEWTTDAGVVDSPRFLRLMELSVMATDLVLYVSKSPQEQK